MANIINQLKEKTQQATAGFQNTYKQVQTAWQESGKHASNNARRRPRPRPKRQVGKETKPRTTVRERVNKRRYGHTADAPASFVDVGAPLPQEPQPGILERIGFDRFVPFAAEPIEKTHTTSPTKANRLHIDVPLLMVLITLLVYGLLMVYSASADFSFEVHGSSIYLFLRQLAFLGLGIVAVGVLAWLDYHIWQNLALYAMGGSLLLLFVVLFIGDQRHGAVRTLFNGSIQPSELAKVITVIYLAVWLYSKREVLHDVNFGLIPLGVILGLVGGLIYLQPDLSAVITVFIIGGIMFFLAGGDLKQISILLVLAIFVGGFVAFSGGLTITGNERVADFIAGWKDPLQASYHVQRSLEAFVKGGLFGVGIGNADTKFTGLPVPHTDSIFAVVGEETGLIGASFMVLLYTLLLWRGMVVASRAQDGLGKLMAAGLSIWLALEAYINMAVMVGLMPFAGNALPFVSVGGSNLVMSLVAIGIILNISRLSERSEERKEKTYSEVVDLRGRHGRRSVSSTRRLSRPTTRTS